MQPNGMNDSRTQLHGPRFPSATSLRSHSQSPKHSPTVSFMEHNRSRNSSLITETEVNLVPPSLRPARASGLAMDITPATEENYEFPIGRSKGKGKEMPNYRGELQLTLSWIRLNLYSLDMSNNEGDEILSERDLLPLEDSENEVASWHGHRPPEVRYIYDAAAERTNEWMKDTHRRLTPDLR